MKINVLGNIIETQHIQRITELISDRISHVSHKFSIELVSGKTIEIVVPSKCFVGNPNNNSKFDKYTICLLEDLPKQKEYIKSLKKITGFRRVLLGAIGYNENYYSDLASIDNF